LARPETLLNDLERGNVDVAVSSHHPVDERDLHSRFLISAEYVSITRKDHPTVGSRLTLARSVELGHVAMALPNLADIAIDNALAELSKERRVVLTVPKPAAVAEIISRSELRATLPRMLIDVGGAPANLADHRPPAALEPVPVFMIHHERTQRSAPPSVVQGAGRRRVQQSRPEGPPQEELSLSSGQALHAGGV
jgi:DNA-binding transcriptional LysR family regulator